MRTKKAWWWKYRWLSHLYATLGAYFWHPCPICGKNFGGHEWLDGNILMNSSSTGRGVCPDCGEKARELNKINFPKLYF